MNRRAFIKQSSLATAAIASGMRTPLFARDSTLKIGLIGSGWYGLVIAKAALQAGGVEIVAVSDVDSEHLKNGVKELEALQGTPPRAFKDYRDLNEKTITGNSSAKQLLARPYRAGYTRPPF